MSPESSISSIISEWLPFFSWVSSLPPFMRLQLCWDAEFSNISSITALSPAPPQAFSQTSCTRGGETWLPPFMWCSRLLFIFLSVTLVHLIQRKQHILGSSLAQITVCVEVWERSSLEGGSQKIQTSSHLELHRSTCFREWEAARTCHWSISNH